MINNNNKLKKKEDVVKDEMLKILKMKIKIIYDRKTKIQKNNYRFRVQLTNLKIFD